MSKRSPILGYNHNVRYRGLVFHVQSEDSGVASPHLFTHLFHHGVIVSTRKLVYDAGSAEESIKSLMQAQHKAVLKDLRRGHFDDKIDSYLGGTPGLLPRGSDDGVERQTEPTAPAEEPASEARLSPPGAVEDLTLAVPTEQMVFEDLSAPVVIQESTPPPSRPPSRIATPPPIPARTMTPDPRRAPAALDTTLRTEAPVFDPPDDSESDQSAEIEIRVEDDDGDEIVVSRRATRDTETELPVGHQVRPTLTITDSKPTLGMINDEARRAAALSDGIPGAIRPAIPVIPTTPDSRKLSNDRPSTINAATLPPARPISRPPPRPALSPPQVISRPLMSDDRSRRESEAVEVYSPAPPSAELPPGERSGQYAQHKKTSSRIPIEGLKDPRDTLRDAPRDTLRDAPRVEARTDTRSDTRSDLRNEIRNDPRGEPWPEVKIDPKIEPRPEPRTGSVPAGLGRPPRAGAPTNAPPRPAMQTGPQALREVPPRPSGQTEPLRARVPTPSRIAPQSGSAAGQGRGNSAGVVMSRPAVIVGGPTKSVGTVPRIRKAREDEGRGFGQGLISEKSLDEVILAYLSEDADDK